MINAATVLASADLRVRTGASKPPYCASNRTEQTALRVRDEAALTGVRC
jgi:hypothetical protein